MEFLELAKKRYSCRKLQGKPVEEEKIRQILEAGNLAPTAVNKQPVHIWTLRTPEAMEKLGQTTHFVFGAPVAIVIGSKATRHGSAPLTRKISLRWMRLSSRHT